MRIARILGLTIVAVLAMTAFSGVTSASAKPTVLCSENKETCPKGQIYSTPTFLKGYFANPELPETYAKLEMPGLSTVSCGVGKFTSELKESAGPLTGEVYKWWFLSCTPAGCTLETGAGEEPGYASQVEAVGGGNGVLRVTAPRLVANCTGGPKFTCTYDATSMEFGIEGGTFENRPHIWSSASVTRNALKSSFVCPPTAKYVSRYEITEPGLPVFVTFG